MWTPCARASTQARPEARVHAAELENPRWQPLPAASFKDVSAARTSLRIAGAPITRPAPSMSDRQDFDQSPFLTIDNEKRETSKRKSSVAFLENGPSAWGFRDRLDGVFQFIHKRFCCARTSRLVPSQGGLSLG